MAVWSDEQQQKALAIAPKISAILSLFGSGFIAQEVLRDQRKRSKTYYQLMAAMSCCDITASSWLFLSTWPIPEEKENVYGNVGNTAICETQGFFLQLGIMTPMYNAALALYYLLVVRYSWPDDPIKKVVKYCHVLILAFGFATAFTGIGLDLFNAAGAWCWIAPLPGDCDESFRGTPDPGEECIRGDNASIYRWVFWYVIVWSSGFFITVAMFLVYLSVWKQEKAMKRYSSASTSGKKRSRKVANQGMLYVAAFYMVWIFPTITRVTQLVNDNQVDFWLIFLLAVFTPMQGFLNFLVYIRPRVIRFKQKNPNIGCVSMTRKVFRPTTEISASLNKESAVRQTQPPSEIPDQSTAVVDEEQRQAGEEEYDDNDDKMGDDPDESYVC